MKVFEKVLENALFAFVSQYCRKRVNHLRQCEGVNIINARFSRSFRSTAWAT